MSFTISILINSKKTHTITVTTNETHICVEKPWALLYPDTKAHTKFKLKSIKSCTAYIKLEIRAIFRTYIDSKEDDVIFGISINGPDFSSMAVDRRTMIHLKKDSLPAQTPEINIKLEFERRRQLNKYVNFMVKETGKIVKDLLVVYSDWFECSHPLTK